MTDTPFRWAILGTGGVARKFVLDLAHGGGVAQVVASRNPDNARAFAKSLGVGAPAESYEAAISADVDAVYIATPPALHEPHALAAIAAGKAVLIEKPFATDAASALRIAEAAKAAGVFVMEAMWTRFQPLPEALKALSETDRLGEIRGFEARFMGANVPDAASSLFAGDQGGALLHRGVYPLSMAHYLLGPVADVTAQAWRGETGADEDSVILLRHASGALSTIRSSLRAQGPEGAVLYGTKGTVEITGPIYRPTGARVLPTTPQPAATGQAGPRKAEAFRESAMGLKISDMLGRLKRLRAGKAIKAPFKGNGYHYQAAAVEAAVRAGRSSDPRMTPEDSIAVLRLIDQARMAWGAAT